MPFIQTKTNTSISVDQEKSLKEKFGKDIRYLPGKTERWLMLDFEGDCRMWFDGKDTSCAMLEVKLFGKAQESAYEKLTAALTEDVASVLGISSDRIYVKYEEIDHWGWNGSNF
ncbi:MAG TPA: hypothetical protein DDY98_05770 [Ruminococcaceae bacterium]|nr:hypothetical protein [Oscillospiraceae bacterium]